MTTTTTMVFRVVAHAEAAASASSWSRLPACLTESASPWFQAAERGRESKQRGRTDATAAAAAVVWNLMRRRRRWANQTDVGQRTKEEEEARKGRAALPSSVSLMPACLLACLLGR